jgi:hypothetical protein
MAYLANDVSREINLSDTHTLPNRNRLEEEKQNISILFSTRRTMRHTKPEYLWRNPGAADGFACGVSLHSHTTHSKENLEFIPQYARKSRFLGKVMDIAEWQYRSRAHREMDFSRAYWTPPLSPRMAMDLETRQIREKLSLPGIVSLTDHDNCEAGIEVDGIASIEWTIPSAPSFFHLGIHNLPRQMARALSAEMNAYTANPDPARLDEMLSGLNDLPEVLIVLNHPLWDEGLVGAARHTQLLESFLARYGKWIHALELNGLRSQQENERVLEVCAQYDLPAISGGDRHGREPNANVNLTCATSFAEFVQEVRLEKLSTVLFMPQYREPLRMRQFEVAWDILRYDLERDDARNSWCDRVFYTPDPGITHPLSFYFGQTGPKLLLPFLAVMHLLEKPAVRPVLRMALSD